MPAVDRLAALPALALVAGLIWLAATPLRHAQSRRHERRADAFALALTGGVDAFDAAIRRLGARHLADERPSAITRWLFYRHPSVGERLEYARAYREMTQV
jgi:STE24 endopeptidase